MRRRLRNEPPVGPRGFSRWVEPVQRGYLLECCDCALVHEMEFRIRDGQPQFRARRAMGHTTRARHGL